MPEANDTTRIEYRQIEGYPAYRVGNDGSGWSRLRRIGTGQGRGTKCVIGDTWKQLTPVMVTGYLCVTLCKDGKLVRRFLHHLVLETFVGPCPEGMIACHYNDDKTDNRLSNLRWDTRKANAADAIRNDRQLRGEASALSKLTDDQVIELREAFAAGGAYQEEIAQRFGVDQTTVSLIVRGELWAHVGGPIVIKKKRRVRMDEETANQIRALVAAGMGKSKAGQQFGVSASAVSRLFSDIQSNPPQT